MNFVWLVREIFLVCSKKAHVSLLQWAVQIQVLQGMSLRQGSSCKLPLTQVARTHISQTCWFVKGANPPIKMRLDSRCHRLPQPIMLQEGKKIKNLCILTQLFLTYHSNRVNQDMSFVLPWNIYLFVTYFSGFPLKFHFL